MRKCKKQRHPFDHLTRASRTARQIELRTGREQGPRNSRILPSSRNPRALKCDIVEAARAKWRNWEFCMSRVCNAQYHY